MLYWLVGLWVCSLCSEGLVDGGDCVVLLAIWTWFAVAVVVECVGILIAGLFCLGWVCWIWSFLALGFAGGFL